VYQEIGEYYENTCSLGSCNYVNNSLLDEDACYGVPQNCGNETCKDPCSYQYCGSATEVVEVTEGIRETCSSFGCGTELNPNCLGSVISIKTCEQGKVCAEVAGTQCNGHSEVDCVFKSFTWTEE
jgi:hypothetical protein